MKFKGHKITPSILVKRPKNSADVIYGWSLAGERAVGAAGAGGVQGEPAGVAAAGGGPGRRVGVADVLAAAVEGRARVGPTFKRN